MLVSKDFRFEASHILWRHPGKCSRLHGHSWRVRVEVEGPIQQETQFVVDYSELSRVVNPLIERLDHRHLNSFIQYPSSENVAVYIAHELRPSFAGMDRLVIAVSETEKTWSIWDSRRSQDMRILDMSLEDGAEWRAPKLERIITDVKIAASRILALEGAARQNLMSATEQLSEAAQLQMYIDSIDFHPVVPSKVM